MSDTPEETPVSELATPPAVALAGARPEQARIAVPVAALKRGLLMDAARSSSDLVMAASYQLSRIGAAGLAGAAALVVAAVVAFTALVTLPGQNEALLGRIASARQTHVTMRPEVALSNVVSSLPSRDAVPNVIREMLQQAKLAGVTLPTGRYSYAPAASGSVARYELEFPVRGEYPSVRDFINRTLTTVPSAGLDRLQIQRKTVGDTIVNANVRFVVFVRGEGGP